MGQICLSHMFPCTQSCPGNRNSKCLLKCSNPDSLKDLRHCSLSKSRNIFVQPLSCPTEWSNDILSQTLCPLCKRETLQSKDRPCSERNSSYFVLFFSCRRKPHLLVNAVRASSKTTELTGPSRECEMTTHHLPISCYFPLNDTRASV
jgi:hypothetical protein